MGEISVVEEGKDRWCGRAETRRTHLVVHVRGLLGGLRRLQFGMKLLVVGLLIGIGAAEVFQEIAIHAVLVDGATPAPAGTSAPSAPATPTGSLSHFAHFALHTARLDRHDCKHRDRKSVV